MPVLYEDRKNLAVRRRYAHAITIRVQLKKLFFWPFCLPRRVSAGKRGRFSCVDIIMAEAMYGIFTVSPLESPNKQNGDRQQGAVGKKDVREPTTG